MRLIRYRHKHISLQECTDWYANHILIIYADFSIEDESTLVYSARLYRNYFFYAKIFPIEALTVNKQ